MKIDLNEVQKDLVKAWMAIDCDTCVNGFYKADYLKEKIYLILLGRMTWHANIEGIDLDKAYEYIIKKTRDKLGRR